MDAAKLRSLDRKGMDTVLANARRLGDSSDPKRAGQARALLSQVEALPPEAWIEVQFRDAKLSPTERRLLGVVAEHPGATSAELTQHLGGRSQSWHLNFGRMCQKRLAERIAAPDGQAANGHAAEFYAGILCEFDEASRGFTLRPDARAALAAAGALAG